MDILVTDVETASLLGLIGNQQLLHLLIRIVILKHLGYQLKRDINNTVGLP
jgi:hypothetical protein